MAKTCPTCHAHHSDELEFCPLDGAHLQALPAAGTPPPPPANRPRRPPPGLGPAMAASGELPQAHGGHRPTLLHAGGILAANAPTPAVEPAVPASTFATALSRGPMSADQAVARLELIAKLVSDARADRHGVLTPWHLQFTSADGSGRPTVADPASVTDPLQRALYAAPELQQTGVLPSAATEVYALGCMLFEAIAGRVPFPGATLAEVNKRHAMAAVPALRMVRRDCDLPPSLEVEIQRALKKRPGDRHATPLAFAEAIRAANREDDRATVAFDMKSPAVQREIAARLAAAEAARAPSAPAAAVAPAQPVAAPAAPKSNTPSSKSSRIMLIVALVVIVALGVGIAVLMQREPETVVVVPPPVIVPVPVVADVAPPAPDVAEPDTQDTVDTEDSVDVEEDVPPDVPAESVRPKSGHGHGPAKVRETPPDTKTEEPKKGNHPAVF
ncbi:MAG: hypothetical protein HY902_12100 [Deltaproteobacteria bacterium]|nr:hypothetical protein [Deltaproteobacteria bacterium]